MAKWTIALFGHYKPHDIGWERRAFPGDIVAFKPIEQEFTWTDTEKKEFLIITIDGPTENQMLGLCEPQWDLTSYRPFAPDKDLATFVTRMQARIAVKRTASDPDMLKRMLDDLESKKDLLYAEHIEATRERSRFPMQHFKKRRFHIPLTTLESLGVVLPVMLDKTFFYNPKLPVIDPTDCFDKFRSRLTLASDGLNTIRPLTNTELDLRRIA